MRIGDAIRARRFRNWAIPRLDEIARLRRAGDSVAVIALADEILAHGDAPAADGHAREVERTLGEMAAAQQELRLYDEAVDTCRLLADRLESAVAVKDRSTLAGILYRMEFIQALHLKLPEAALETCDELASRLGEDPEMPVVRWVAWGLRIRGHAYRMLGRNRAAAGAFRDIVDRYDGTEDPELADCVATAMVDLARTLGMLGRWQESLKLYDHVVDRLEGSERGATGDGLLAHALVGSGFVLGQLDRPAEAARRFGRVDELFGQTTEAELVDTVAIAMYDKAGTELEVGRPEAAVETMRASLDWLRDRAGNAPHLTLDGRIASARWQLYLGLEGSGCHAEAMQELENMVAEFGESDDADALEIATSARMELADGEAGDRH